MPLKDLIHTIAVELVSHPDQVTVNELAGEHHSIIELRVAKSDLGKVIGRDGRTANSIRRPRCSGIESRARRQTRYRRIVVVDPDTWIPLAEVAKPHGVKGEVRLRLFNRDSGLLSRSSRRSWFDSPMAMSMKVLHFLMLRVRPTIRFFSSSLIDDRDRADELRGAILCARRRDFEPLEDGEFYFPRSSRVLVLVPEAEGEKQVGVVVEFRSHPSVETVVVRRTDTQAEHEVPLVDGFVKLVDPTRCAIWLHSEEVLQEF